MTGDRVSLFEGDITTIEVDAVVNAANSSLLGGGGVDGAIHAAAGPRLLEECRTLGGCPTGEARLTGGYDLPASHVIHTVGPVWHGGTHSEPGLLARCYRSALKICRDRSFASVAFPSISTGVYGYPIESASRVAVGETVRFLADSEFPRRVIFACFSRKDARVYEEALREIGIPV